MRATLPRLHRPSSVSPLPPPPSVQPPFKLPRSEPCEAASAALRDYSLGPSESIFPVASSSGSLPRPLPKCLHLQLKRRRETAGRLIIEGEKLGLLEKDHEIQVPQEWPADAWRPSRDQLGPKHAPESLRFHAPGRARGQASNVHTPIKQVTAFRGSPRCPLG